MTDELEVLLDLLFELDVVWPDRPALSRGDVVWTDRRELSRDDASLVFMCLLSRRDEWLRRALRSGDPRAPGVIAAWARAHGWSTLADEVLAGAEDWPSALWRERFAGDAPPVQRITTGYEELDPKFDPKLEPPAMMVREVVRW